MNNYLKFLASFVLAGMLVGGFARAVPEEAPVVREESARAEGTMPRAADDAAARAHFEELALSARAAFVVDGATGKVLFEKNADAQLPLASLTKVMNALTALSLAPRFALVSVTPELLEVEGDSGLRSDEQWPLEKLLSFSLTASSNDGAFAAAAAASSFITSALPGVDTAATFTDAMNRTARALELTASYFLNPTGLDESAELAGGYGSARDISRLMLTTLRTYPELFSATTERAAVFTETGGNGHTAENTNKITDEIPLLRASKTGFTDLAGGNLSVIFDAGVGKPISVTVLGSTEEERFTDVKKLVAAALRALQSEYSNPLLTP